MKKIISLIGATAITTSGVTPLMAMMPNNKNQNFSIGESSSSVVRGEDKILKNSIYTVDKTKKTFFAPWIIYLSSETIQNLNKISTNDSILHAQKSDQMIDFIIQKVATNNSNDDVNEFVSKMNRKSLSDKIFYNNFYLDIPEIFSKPLIKNNNGVGIIINEDENEDKNGRIIHIFDQKN
ncbi:hypothetical protein [Spiroplasma phoeniceum]|uniref:Uncharacterized protein n=1 Tax=Spiroplasma phoeniceum P40 TaxID=1276259 RepID=A0A345DLP5_9MOLU|nr:hypothetical protein [Spiroplasma phoeniceum]AXF95133.1 hypothetical protein SDAV_00117 [Spiroplasma phoeniceum P40]